ncbi:MAG: PmoA family protein [Verrucomicrobia bacterium]|nr:PmoA family protein [Verrucomicrobiota bacterium]
MHALQSTRLRIFFIATLFIASLSTGVAQSNRFAFRQDGNRIILSHGGDPVVTYVFSDTQTLRPYFQDACAPGRIQVTRNHPPVQGTDATDHATMHPGIWMGFGDIGGHDFWRNKATVVHDRFVNTPAVSNGIASFGTANRFVSEDGETICTQLNDFSWRVADDGFLMIWDSTFVSDTGDFVFGDQEEMGLGARVATAIAVKNGGVIQNSNGQKNEKESWGKTADWTDYSGILDGKLAGIMILTDPANFRPSWFHNRDYGAFVANPFGRNAFTRGEKSAVKVRKGERFRIRFGVLLHSSPIDRPIDTSKAYSAFLQHLAR